MESLDKALEGYSYFLEHSGFELYQEYFDNNIQDELAAAKKVVLEYLNDEFDQIHTNEVFKDLEHVGVAFTTTEDSDREIQIEVDLKNFKLNRYLDSELIESVKFESLSEMSEKCLSALDFSDLTYIDEGITKKNNFIHNSIRDII